MTMLRYTSLLNLLCHPSSLLLFILLCSFVLPKNKPHKKQGREAANREGGSKQRTNRHSHIFNEFLQLGLKLVELSGETQITEGPENSQVMKA